MTNISGIHPRSYLTPSEIELWELSKKATRRMPNVSLDDDFEDERDAITEWHKTQGDFRAAASPDKIAFLLETLEKTREALAELLTHHDEDEGGCDRLFNAVIPEHPAASNARALLSGFSGDASKEERGG